MGFTQNRAFTWLHSHVGPFFPVKCAAGGGLYTTTNIKTGTPKSHSCLTWLTGIQYFFKPLFLFLKICLETKRTEQTKKNKQNQRDATSRVNEEEKEKTQVGG